MKIKWITEEDDPDFKRSEDGRFTISPLYIGRERPQAWQIDDIKTKQRRSVCSSLKFAKEIVQGWFDKDK